MKNNFKNKQLNKNPYRGILTEIAKEQEVSRQAIHQAIRIKNLRILEILSQKMKERKQAISRLSKELEVC